MNTKEEEVADEQQQMEVDEGYEALYAKNMANKPLKTIEVSSALIS